MNQLSAVSSAVTVAVVLNVRKFASLLVSVFVFGSRLEGEAQVGAGMVTVGALWYAFEARGRGEGVGIRDREDRMAGKRDGDLKGGKIMGNGVSERETVIRRRKV